MWARGGEAGWRGGRREVVGWLRELLPGTDERAVTSPLPRPLVGWGLLGGECTLSSAGASERSSLTQIFSA